MLRFIDGWDHYSTEADIQSKWGNGNYGSVWDVSVSGGRYGGNCMKTHSGGTTGSWVIKVLDSRTAWIVGFAIKFDSTSTTDILRFDDSAGSVQVFVGIDLSGHLYIATGVNKTGTVLGTGTTTLNASTWYYIEALITIAGSTTTGTVKVRLGGVDEVVVAAGSNTNTAGTGTVARIRLGKGGFGGQNIFFDDLYICDTSGTANNTFLGDVRIESLFPAGAGSHTAFTHNGAASNYLCVNESTENGDTTYVSTATVNAIDSYVLGSLSGSPQTVFGVQANIFARKDDAGTRQAAAVIRTSSTDYLGSTFGLADSYAYYSSIFEANPNTAVQWTVTDVNSLEAGVKLVF